MVKIRMWELKCVDEKIHKVKLEELSKFTLDINKLINYVVRKVILPIDL